MTGDDFVSKEYESVEVVPIHKGDEEELPTCCNLIFIFFLGLGLGFTLLVLSLGLMALGLFVMIPIEQWVEGYSIVFQIAVEIPLFVIFILLFPISFYIVGYINRFGVERISKTKQPNNRKWTILSGFIVYSIGWILIYNILGTTMMVEQPESYWIGILSFALINSIEWFCLFLVGVVGYIVALKLPIFRN